MAPISLRLSSNNFIQVFQLLTIAYNRAVIAESAVRVSKKPAYALDRHVFKSHHSVTVFALIRDEEIGTADRSIDSPADI